jgi:hypothetical protein
LCISETHKSVLFSLEANPLRSGEGKPLTSGKRKMDALTRQGVNPVLVFKGNTVASARNLVKRIASPDSLLCFPVP